MSSAAITTRESVERDTIFLELNDGGFVSPMLILVTSIIVGVGFARFVWIVWTQGDFRQTDVSSSHAIASQTAITIPALRAVSAANTGSSVPPKRPFGPTSLQTDTRVGTAVRD
jgi:hypothetical protein